MIKILLILFFVCFLVSGEAFWQTYQYGKSGAPKKHLFKGQDNNGLFWYGQTGYTIISFDGEFFTHHNVVDTSISKDTISSDYYMANDSTFWLSLAYGDAYDAIKLDFPSLEKTYYKRSDIPIEYDKIFSPQVSPTGEVWFQTQDSGAIQLKDDIWTKYDTANSTLPLNFHNLICFDSSSNTYLSVGTTSGSKGGVSKFDGSSWEHWDYNNSPIPKALVRDIKVDKENALWVASDSGLNRLKNGEWLTWTVYDMPFKDTPTWKWFSSVNVSPDNTIWTFANQKHLYYKDGKWHNLNETYETYPQDDIYSGEPTFDSSGNVWIATTRSGIVKFDYEKCSVFPSADYPNKIRTNSKGVSWSGFSKYDKDTDSFLSPLTAQNTGISNDTTYCISVMANNTPIIVTNSGISIRDSLQRWSYYDDSTLPNLPLSDIRFLISKSDTILGFTQSGNVTLFTNNRWIKLDDLTLPANSIVNDIYKDNSGIIWIATNKGLTKYFDGICEQHPLESLPTSNIHNVVLVNNTPIVGISTGIYHYSNTAWSKYTKASEIVSQDYITDLEVDTQERLWASTLRDGVLLLSDSKWTLFDDSNSDIASEVITKIKSDKLGNIWAITEENGVSKYDGNIWKTYSVENSPIVSNELNDITFDQQNTKWIASKYSGVSYYKNDDSTKILSKSSTDKSKGILVQKSKLIFNISSKEAQIRIYNIQGKVIQKQTWTRDSGEFHIPRNLVKGIYFINVKTSERQNIFRFRI